MIVQITPDNISVYIDKIATLYIKVFSAPPRYEIIDKELLKKEIILNLLEKIIYVYLNNNNIVGVVSIEPTFRTKDYKYMSSINETLKNNPNSFLISESFVDSSHRGKGIAESLFRKIITTKKDNKIFSRSRLDAVAQNKLFSKIGFKVIDKILITTNGVRSEKYLWEYYN